MTTMTRRDTQPLLPYHPDWPSVHPPRHNVIIEGPVASTHALVLRLEPHIPRPVAWKRPNAPLGFVCDETRALILEDVSTLSLDDQIRLLAHFGRAKPGLQVVSTCEQSLFAFVTSGLFDAELYYRLNVVLLRLAND